MNDFLRIVQEGNLVQIVTKKGETFVGTLLPMYFVILDNGILSAEIYLSQHETHKGEPFGTVGLALHDIERINPC